MVVELQSTAAAARAAASQTQAIQHLQRLNWVHMTNDSKSCAVVRAKVLQQHIEYQQQDESSSSSSSSSTQRRAQLLGCRCYMMYSISYLGAIQVRSCVNDH
jgi:hypothetical protein